MARRSLPDGRLVGNGEVAAYGIAGGGQVFGYSLVTSYLMYFYINVFHIDPRVVGLMLFIEGIWDIVNNPLAGMVIDRTRTKQGKMIPYLRIFMAPLAVFTILLFVGPYLIDNPSAFAPSKIAWMFITYFVWEVFYTITDVSYWGLSAAISPNEQDRNRVLTFNNVSQSIGNTIPMILVPLLMDYSAANPAKLEMRSVFLILGLVAGVVGIGLFSLVGICCKERVEQSREGSSFRESARELVRNPGLRLIVISGLIRSLAGVGGVLQNYYFIDVLGYASMGVLVGIPSMITWCFSYALLPRIRRRYDARRFSILSAVLIGVSWLLAFVIGLRWYRSAAVMVPVLMVQNGLFGLISAPMSIIQNEMLADATDYSEWTTGKRSEGVSFSLRITTVKIGGTIVQSIGSALLSLIGYVTSPDNARVTQSGAVQFRIWTIFALVPGIIYLLSAIPFLFYDLIGAKRERMRRELEERRGMGAPGARS